MFLYMVHVQRIGCRNARGTLGVCICNRSHPVAVVAPVPFRSFHDRARHRCVLCCSWRQQQRERLAVRAWAERSWSSQRIPTRWRWQLLLIDWFVHCFDWLPGCLIDWLLDWLLVDWSDWLIDCSDWFDWLIDRSDWFDWLIDWFDWFDWLVCHCYNRRDLPANGCRISRSREKRNSLKRRG